ncbi:sterol regulatory element-binding protein ECM22 [Lipomyces tetrasporus]|uniref:Sterol regulatory element-binding protein ECM22 n=1 Tax=Lipomyces tetrasporus TaxID=54092 RepID=A0AAD7QXS2_9ASCO|nr:sterol regulatory element-binding protein ECM22 [Lipomyces tetrasporus]KAJ8103438.1 sterol regulatory element-binding protein ECM22 [Lipomyces tetrasporus]
MSFPGLRFKQVIVSSSGHASTQQEQESSRRSKSKFGCRDCKAKRVKCDGAYPTCMRCQRQGLVCLSYPRLTQWQVETPWLSLQPNKLVNRRLLRYWLEKVSQTLVIDPENNPFSFPALEYIAQSSALLHAIQSLSASHEQYFPANTPVIALEERGKAISCLRKEMDQSHHTPHAFFLTVMLLALAQGADSDTKDYGKQHLFAARALINSMLQGTSALTNNEPVFRLCLGMYLYWDMCSSFLVDSWEPQGLNLFNISIAVHRMGDWHHPMYGTCTGLVFIIANVGRYCRQILDSPQNRNLMQEAVLEDQLTTWKTSPQNPGLGHLYEAFRNHGLIFLYRARAHAQSSHLTDPDSSEAQESLIQQYAEETVGHLMQIPATSYYLNFQSLPLLAAGSELTESNNFLRDQVRDRLRAIYSLNRLPANLLALQLLEELWDARDSGNPSFWLPHMLQQDWRLLLG